MTQTTTPHWTRRLKALGACSEAVEWAWSYDSLGAAWAACPRGDWMLLLVAWTSGAEPESDGRRSLVLAACECARLALPYVPEGEDEPRVAIETAEAWANGTPGVTLGDVRRAAGAVFATNTPAPNAAPNAAAFAAVHAASAAVHSALAAAGAAAHAASAVANAAARAADYTTEWRRTLAECADIVRHHYPEPPALGEEV